MNRLIQVLAASGMLLAAPYHNRKNGRKCRKLESAGGRTGGSCGTRDRGANLCLPGGSRTKFGWVLKAPEAELADSRGKQVVHHSAGPTWKHVDGSEVKGKVLAKQDAPKGDAIPWLLLAAASHTGEGFSAA